MTVLVDTPIWSFAYRRVKRSAREQLFVDELVQLIRLEQVVLIGAICQEVLTGIRDTRQFESVRTTLRGFPVLPLTVADYESAAALHNHCRRRGIQGSPTDFLICAASLRYDASVFTTDADFDRYITSAAIKLHNTTR
jgi:predicted nucleic acid-binding protein